MKKKNKLIGLILIGLMVFGIVYGGELYMDKKAEQQANEEQRNTFEIERDAIVALKNTFSNISFVEIEQIDGPNNMTGSYQIIFLMKNNLGMEVQFDAIYVEGENELKNYGIENEEIQKEGKTVTQVSVVYADGTGGKQ